MNGIGIFFKQRLLNFSVCVVCARMWILFRFHDGRYRENGYLEQSLLETCLGDHCSACQRVPELKGGIS